MLSSSMEPRRFLTSLFEAAVSAADPYAAIQSHLPERPKGRTVVVGAGKGAAHLARALERVWDGPLEGIVVTRYGFGVSCERIEVLEAAHPVPDRAGLSASNRMLSTVANLTADDLVIALFTGGGSALLPAPPTGLALGDEIALNEVLLASGAPISAMNTIRKQVSRIKGGRLARAAWPARVATLVVSDVPGDNPAYVASGPTIPDTAGRVEALAAIRQYNIPLPAAIAKYFRNSLERAPHPSDPRFSRNTHCVIASASVSLEAAAGVARTAGVEAVVVSDNIEGEAREVGSLHAAIVREIAQKSRPLAQPIVVLSGGETTVTLRGKGKGGRNSEFLLALARDIDGLSDVCALAADTDGVDGSESNAGAFAGGETIGKMRAAGLDASKLLDDNDSWSAFSATGDLFEPGPTGTNINDFRAILLW
ncbi:glycerate kinase [Ensifer adhaerens]|uniref:glycerate kinase type-2 family protein n=1 Tax=Ensifer canadensis TaxID=555315 RepID=UPI0014902137|nr:glycerate kinase [Ensifer canadensis]NOV20297.1 glycerate kinase [Ensifer canadensis]